MEICGTLPDLRDESGGMESSPYRDARRIAAQAPDLRDESGGMESSPYRDARRSPHKLL